MPLDLTSLRRHIERWNGSSIRYDLSGYQEPLEEIGRREADLELLDSADLQALASALATRACAGNPEADLAVEAFALAREASRRALDMRPFDVQILAALAMADGNLVEMATGEGKTLAAVMPAFLAGLSGKGVHVLTFNDYLAQRDAEWMGPVYEFLGLSVGWVAEAMSADARRAAYACDVTYVTAKEAGFDLLREHLAGEPEELVHRPFHFAIVDEADSILVDEARVPLVIAGSAGTPPSSSFGIAQLVRGLEKGRHWATDEYQRAVELTDEGMARVESTLDCGNLAAPANLALLTEINSALHATYLLHRDVDYIVKDGRIRIVDEFTGRVVEDRHWPDGLQAALEAKEKLARRSEGRILSSITLQHLLKLYPRLAGMTATARPAAEELRTCFDLDVVVIPPNRPSIRVDEPDRVFTHRRAKHQALVGEIARVHASGRPILVGTASVEESEELGTLLEGAGVRCEILNARNDEEEAAIVAEAGALGAVTISTNMAGRGTDIKLGGADESDREQVTALGGLLVLGTNRHESLRIDRQLRGRAGRQGDPGASRFFVSLEDPLIVRYGVNDLIPEKFYPARQKDPLDNPFVRHEIARAQRIIEGQNTEIRKTLYGYSALLEEHRQVVHKKRRSWLDRLAPGRLAELSPGRHESAVELAGAKAVAQAERRISLFHWDRAWSRHLARAADLREGIHLLRIGGEDPLVEFTRAVAESFKEMMTEVEEAVVETFESVEITAGGVDLEGVDLRGPSSTWTYLVNDDPFRDQLATALGGNVGVGVAAAALAGPFWIASALYQHFRNRRRSRQWVK
ncbi:MAG: accessory Sec system translocase SecA2 [Thermoanaerobaculia bacterium]